MYWKKIQLLFGWLVGWLVRNIKIKKNRYG
jgi:hypothetical protein